MKTDKLVDFDHVTDYISRESAIALTDQHCFETSYDAVWMEEALRNLPAADVRPVVRAFWVGEMDGVGICSNCKRLDHIDPLATHCRYCGAEITEPQTLKNASQNADDDAMMPAI